MKPICFPSTYVSYSVAQALTACFGQFIVYQPLAWENTGTNAPLGWKGESRGHPGACGRRSQRACRNGE